MPHKTLLLVILIPSPLVSSLIYYQELDMFSLYISWDTAFVCLFLVQDSPGYLLTNDCFFSVSSGDSFSLCYSGLESSHQMTSLFHYIKSLIYLFQCHSQADDSKMVTSFPDFSSKPSWFIFNCWLGLFMENNEVFEMKLICPNLILIFPTFLTLVLSQFLKTTLQYFNPETL